MQVKVAVCSSSSPNNKQPVPQTILIISFGRSRGGWYVREAEIERKFVVLVFLRKPAKRSVPVWVFWIITALEQVKSLRSPPLQTS